MTLAEWMDTTKVDVKSVAKSLGVSPGAVYGWLAGAFVPSTRRLIALHRLTDGKLDIATFAYGPTSE